MKRREFLKILGVGSLFIFTGNKIKFKNKNFLIRPPGSISEDDFIFKCVRCGECMKVCPSHCLKPVSVNEGIFEWGTPHIIPRESACLLCLSCSKVCPTGAIQKINFEDVKIGTAKINRERCLVWKYKKDCYVCMEYCPVSAIYKHKSGGPEVIPEKCKGCGQCEKNCPVIGEPAIKVYNEGERRILLKKRGGE